MTKYKYPQIGNNYNNSQQNRSLKLYIPRLPFHIQNSSLKTHNYRIKRYQSIPHRSENRLQKSTWVKVLVSDTNRIQFREL